MRNFINLFEKAHNVAEVFDLATARLTKTLTPKTTYETAKYAVMTTLQDVANQFAQPDHPIKVLVDFFTHDGTYGRFSAHGGEGWLIINLLNMTEEDWAFETTPEDLEQVIFRASQTFSQEMIHYEQFCQNWQHHEETNNSAPYRDPKGKSGAASAARELVRHYGDVAAVKTALKNNTRETALASPSMRLFLKPENKANLRGFLSDLYGQLDILASRSQ